MKDFLGDRLTGLWDSIHHYRDTMGRSRNPEILNTVDSVVDSTDSRIRLDTACAGLPEETARCHSFLA